MAKLAIPVTGSVSWSAVQCIRDHLHKVWSRKIYSSCVLINGGAQGADTIAARYAEAVGWIVSTIRRMKKAFDTI